MSLIFGPPIVVPGVVVPCPSSLTYWYEGAAAVLPARLIVYDGLLIGMVTEVTGGGLGSSSVVVAEDGTPGVQVQIEQQGIWDVVMGLC